MNLNVNIAFIISINPHMLTSVGLFNIIPGLTNYYFSFIILACRHRFPHCTNNNINTRMCNFFFYVDGSDG